MGALVYVRLNGNITTLDVAKQLGRRPAKSPVADKVTNLKPMNILVMGVDTRNLDDQVRHDPGRPFGYEPAVAPVGRPQVGGRCQQPARLDDPGAARL